MVTGVSNQRRIRALARRFMYSALAALCAAQSWAAEEPLTVVRIEADRSVLFESNALAARITISRTGLSDSAVRVAFEITGTARNGRDIARILPEVTIPAGQDSVSFDVAPVDDGGIEAPETLMLTLVPRTKPFSIVLLPDTQCYSGALNGGVPEMFTSQTEWVVAHREERDISFLLHEGDCTQSNTAEEWVRTKASMRLLDDAVPYAIAAGNHDGLMTSENNTALFNQTFPLTNYSGLPTFGGAFESNRMDNVFHQFSAGGVDWLVLALEFGPRDAVLDWANSVVTNHPQSKVIVLTHTHIYSDSTLHGSSPTHEWTPRGDYGRMNDGVDVWEKLVRRHANMAFVFNGHVLNSGQGRLVGVGDHGNRVYQMLCNYQMLPGGGQGILRIIKFFPLEDRLTAESYTPFYDVSLTDPANAFAYTNLGVFTGVSNGYAIDPEFGSVRLDLVSDDLDWQPPGVVGVAAQGVPAVIRVTFDEPVDPGAAQDVGHYSVAGVTLTNAVLLPDGATVALWPAHPLLEYTNYSLAITGVRDATPQSNSIPTSIVVAFTYQGSLLGEEFSESTATGWTTVDEGAINAPSVWRVFQGQFLQDGNIHSPDSTAGSGRRGTYAYWNDSNALAWSNYTALVTLRSYDDDGIGVMFRFTNPSNYYKFDMDAQRGFHKLFKMVNGVETTLASITNGYAQGLIYTLRIEASGSTLRVLLNGQQSLPEVTDTSLARGTVALYCWGNSGARFDQVRILPAYRSPAATIVSPTEGATYWSGTNITVNVELDAPDGRVARVELLDNSTVIRVLSPPGYSVTLSNVAIHEFNASVRVIDDFDLQHLSPRVRWQIIAPEPPPLFILHPASQSVPDGSGALFRGLAFSATPFHYWWKFNGTIIPGATNSILFLDAVQAAEAGTYTLSAVNAGGERISAPATLTISGGAGQETNTALRPEGLLLDGRFLYSLAGPVGIVQVETSSDLVHWVAVNSFTNNGGRYYLASPGAPQPWLFFRTRILPAP